MMAHLFSRQTHSGMYVAGFGIISDVFVRMLFIYRWKKNKPPLLSTPHPPIAEHTMFGSYFTAPSTKMYIANYFKLWKLCEFYWIYLVHKLFKHIVLLVTWIQLKIACTDCMHIAYFAQCKRSQVKHSNKKKQFDIFRNVFRVGIQNEGKSFRNCVTLSVI